MLLEDPKTNERNTAEVQLLWELRQALRRRTVHIPSSLSFQSRAKMLDSRGSTIRAPRSDYPVKTMIKELVEEMEYGLERVSEAVERGELKLDGTKIKVRRLAAQRTPSELKGVRRELYSAYARVQFPDLIMAVDAETHFSAEILGRPADNETELLHLYAGILGQSMDLSANRLSLMVGLTPEGLAHAMHVLEDPAPLVRANEAVLAYMHSHASARAWGSPFDCAADAMSLDMPEYFWFTSPDPKRRVSGAATYVHTQGAARYGDASFRAGHAHGLLLRTNDLLRSYTDPDYRREKLCYLNHNERTHQLQRQIRKAGSGSTRGRRDEELSTQSPLSRAVHESRDSV
jgi:Tn3 transposase DDE domain